jgi:hypothetical protein
MAARSPLDTRHNAVVSCSFALAAGRWDLLESGRAWRRWRSGGAPSIRCWYRRRERAGWRCTGTGRRRPNRWRARHAGVRRAPPRPVRQPDALHQLRQLRRGAAARPGRPADVEATALAACLAGNSLAAAYHALGHAYRHAGRPAAIREYHQGGLTGYLARELLATGSTAPALDPGMALACNPSFGGMRMEDTFPLGERGLENLTFDPAGPAASVQGRMRPLWLAVAC